MLNILHAADLHLDSAFGGLTREQAALRRAESREMIDRMVDFGNDHHADLMLLAGDLFDSDSIYSQTAEELSAALERFRGQVVIAPGNHDYYGPKSAYLRLKWPENVHIFTSSTMERLDLPTLGATVYGAAFTTAEAPAWAGFRAEGDGIALGVLHGEAGVKDSPYRPISLSAIEGSGLDYLALGHVHKCSGLQKAGDTYWAYPGCPEGRGFDETGDKGFLFGTVERGSVNVRFVPFARRRYEVVEVDVTDRDVMEAILRALPLKTDTDSYRIVLRGETAEKVDTQQLSDRLSPRFFTLELRDKTTAARSIWERSEEDTLRGLFLRDLRAKYDGAQTDDERALIEQAVHFGLSAMEGGDLT